MAPRRARAKATEAEVPRDATAQRSYSGTPRYRGETQPDEYVVDLLEPVKRMEIFEEMRASDEGINTAIAAREQLIGSATWMLSSPSDAPVAREVLEFCEDNIYPVLPELLRHLAGAIQYGFGAVEKVFEWADEPFVRTIVREKLRRPAKSAGRRIYLRKLAHIRQRTIHTFIVPEKGDLQALRQYVYADGRFVKVDIEADRVLLWTYNRRGDDYWGVPPTRHAYKAWKLKSQLERLNVLGFDRFGTGTPIAEEGENWSEPERTRLADFLKNWRSGTSSFLIHPFGGKITLVSGSGEMTMSALEWVKFYGLGIAKTYLTQGTELGSTETGARALGETFTEQTESIVQSDCEDIANLINEHLIIPLVVMNFGPQESYPAFTPSQRVRKSTAIGMVIGQLVRDRVVSWDESDEAWFRDVMKLPDIDLDAREEKKRERERLLATVGAQPALPPSSPEKETKPVIERLRSLRFTLHEGAPTPAVAGESTHRTREFSEWESRVLRPEIVTRDLDTASLRLTGEVQDVLREIDLELRDAADGLARRGPEAIAMGIRNIAVPGRLRRKLRTVLQEAAVRARAYGENSVHLEIARQQSPGDAGPARRPELSRFQQLQLEAERAVLASDPTPEEKARELEINAEIDRTVEDEVDRRERSVRDSLRNTLAIAGTVAIVRLVEIVRTAVSTALESLSTARTADNVTGVVNAGFGVGRKDAASELLRHPPMMPAREGRVVGQIDRLVTKVYSAVMDFGTCDECARWDGAHFPIDYPEDFSGVAAPNPRCDGSIKRCRCVWIYVTESEMASVVAPSKGPIPIVAATPLSRAQPGQPALIETRQTLDVVLEAQRQQTEVLRELSTKIGTPPEIHVAPPEVHVEPPLVNVTVAPQPRKTKLMRWRDSAGKEREVTMTEEEEV